MSTFFNILVISSIIISICAILILGWALIAIKRKEKGIQDFKEIPFFAQEMKMSYDIHITNSKKKVFKNTIKETEPTKTKMFFFSFSPNKTSDVNEIKLDCNNEIILN